VGGEALLGDLAPVVGERPPVARRPLRSGLEPLGLDARAGVVTLERGERDAPTVPLRPRLGDVRDDPIHPGSERRSSLEAFEPVQDPQPRLLHDLLRDGPRGDVHPSHPEHRGLVLLDEHHERGLVAGTEAFDQGEVGGGGEDRVVHGAAS
jgi:hypothetical protein